MGAAARPAGAAPRLCWAGGFGTAVPRTGWGHSGRASAPDLASQNAPEVSHLGLPPQEILDSWVRVCPGECWGLLESAVLGGEVAPDCGGA